MDKRTLYFVIAMSIALFGINSFFSYLEHDRLVEWNEQQIAKKNKLKTDLLDQIKIKTAPITSFTFDGKALQLDKFLLLIDQHPKEIAGYKLIVKEPLAIYSKVEDAKLSAKRLPEYGNFELQLIFTSENKEQRVVFAEYQNGAMLVPLATLVQEFPEQFKDQQLEGEAIALLKTDKAWQFVGVYQAKDNVLIPPPAEWTSPEEKKHEVTPTEGEEAFYVLENNYQQLVFSTKGAALAEINLPFQTKENTVSVVREIEFDRTMVQKDPQNAHFPSRSYTTIKSDGTKEFHEQGALGGYYPLLRRSLIEKPPYKNVILPSSFYALNIISNEFGEVAKLNYQVKSFTKNQIVFEATQPYRRITKTYTLPDSNAPYILDLTIEIEGDARGLLLTSGLPEAEWINGGVAPALKYRMTRKDGKAVVEMINLPTSDIINSTAIDWVANSNGFFGMIVDPLNKGDLGYKAIKIAGTTAPSRLVEIDQEWNRFKADDMPGYAIQLPLSSKGGTLKFRIFAGPFATPILESVDNTYSDSTTGYNPDYISSQTSHGWFTFISDPFAKFLFMLMKMFYNLTNSWGIAIILLTVALRIMIYPLSAWSFKSMRKMQEVGPSLKAVQEKYKNDPKRMNLEMAALYREKGVNPLSGCLPILIQLPFLFGMFDLLKSTFELRGAPFIPGWIDDLAAPDVVFSWSYPIFFIGTEFHLLPIITALVMFIQARMSAPNKDPKTMTDQERTQRTMSTFIALPFAILFYNAPSGLCIYWIFSTLLGILQQKWTNSRMVLAPVTVEVIDKKKKK